MTDTPRLVVCAAVRFASGLVVCGPRHGDCLNYSVQFGINTKDKPECGFVDQHNKFLTRAEAWSVADAAGQIRRPTGLERHYNDHRPAGVGDEGMLFSENLY